MVLLSTKASLRPNQRISIVTVEIPCIQNSRVRLHELIYFAINNKVKALGQSRLDEVWVVNGLAQGEPGAQNTDRYSMFVIWST